MAAYREEEDPFEEDIVFDQTGLLNNTSKMNTAIRRVSSGKCVLFAKTLGLCGAFFGLGLCIAIPGPTFLSPLMELESRLSPISNTYIARTSGYIIGSIIGGVLFDRFNRLFLLFLSLLLTAVFITVTPWCQIVWLLETCMIILGITMGFLDTGGNVLCLDLWGRNSGPFMQALHFSFGLGAFVAPLLAAPFLEPAFANSTLSTEFSHVITEVPVHIEDHSFHENRLKRSVEALSAVHNISGADSMKTTQDNDLFSEASASVPVVPTTLDTVFNDNSTSTISDIHSSSPSPLDFTVSITSTSQKPRVPKRKPSKTDGSKLGNTDWDKYHVGRPPPDDLLPLSTTVASSVATSAVTEASTTAATATATFVTSDSSPNIGLSGSSMGMNTDSTIHVTTPVSAATMSNFTFPYSMSVTPPSTRNTTVAATVTTTVTSTITTTPINIITTPPPPPTPSPSSPLSSPPPPSPSSSPPQFSQGSKVQSLINITSVRSEVTSSVQFGSSMLTGTIFPTTGVVEDILSDTKSGHEVYNLKIAVVTTSTPPVSTVPSYHQPREEQRTDSEGVNRKNIIKDNSEFEQELPSLKTSSSIDRGVFTESAVMNSHNPSLDSKELENSTPLFYAKPLLQNNKNKKKENEYISNSDSQKYGYAYPLFENEANTTKIFHTNGTKNRTEQENIHTSLGPVTSTVNYVSTSPPRHIHHKPGTFDNDTEHINTILDIFANRIEKYGFNKMQFTYLIVGIFVFSISLVFLGFLCHNPRDPKSKQEGQGSKKITNKVVHKLLIALMALFFFLYMGLEVTYGQLVLAFTIHSSLQLPQSTGSVISVVFWGSFAAMRFASIFFASGFDPVTMLMLNFAFCTSGTILVSALANHLETALWVGTALIGVGLASMFPTGILWIERYIHVSNKVAAIFVIGVALGEMVCPVTVYQLMVIEPMLLMHTALVINILCILTFVALWWLASRHGEKYSVISNNGYQLANQHDEEEDMIDMSPSGSGVMLRRHSFSSEHRALLNGNVHRGP